MENKLSFTVFFLWVTVLFVSCGTSDRYVKMRDLKKAIADSYIVPAPVYIIQHDTIRQKPLTEAERKKLARNFFQNGYDEFVQPEFDKLELVNAKLERDLHLLLLTNTNIRNRSIKSRDSLNGVIEADKKEQLRLNNLLIESSREHTREIARQDSINVAEAAEQKTENADTQRNWHIAILILTIVLTYVMIKLHITAKKTELNRLEWERLKKLRNNE